MVLYIRHPLYLNNTASDVSKPPLVVGPIAESRRRCRRRRRDVGPQLVLLSPPGTGRVGRMVGGRRAPSA